VNLSIALCTYNGAQYLPEQLDSFAAQSRLPDELVICDDGSTDETVAQVRKFEAEAPFPVWLFINERNLGSTKNFEQAIARCSGDVIFLADQDDVWLPEKIARMEAVLAANDDLALVFSDAEIVDANLNPLSYTLWQGRRFNQSLRSRLRRGEAFPVLLKQNYITGATMAFRARYRPLALPISSLWIHDGWIALMLATVAPLALIDTPLIQYRQHAHNQVGGTRRTPTEWVEAPRQSYLEQLNLSEERYMAFLERVHDLPGVPNQQQVCDQLQAKIAHVRARAHLPDKRLQRIPRVLREVGAGRYRRYSLGGPLAALRDLWL
jgi:hypothetical protein